MKQIKDREQFTQLEEGTLVIVTNGYFYDLARIEMYRYDNTLEDYQEEEEDIEVIKQELAEDHLYLIGKDVYEISMHIVNTDYSCYYGNNPDCEEYSDVFVLTDAEAISFLKNKVDFVTRNFG